MASECRNIIGGKYCVLPWEHSGNCEFEESEFATCQCALCGEQFQQSRINPLPHACRNRPMFVPDKPEGKKFDAGKLPLDLLPFRALTLVAEVLAFGAEKYGPDNWRFVEHRQRRYFAAALRHLFAHALGERVDVETGKSHLAHAACCVLFLLDEWMP